MAREGLELCLGSRFCKGSREGYMRVGVAVLALSVFLATGAVAQESDSAKVAEYMKTLPAVTVPAFDEARRETLAAAAIGCEDRPEEAPENRNNYLWQYEKPAQLLDGYDKNRAFFGCSDWHDAVGSMWALMSLLRQDPKTGVASGIKDIATTHFRKSNMDGEYAFFTTPSPPGSVSANFEEPYGYSWLLKLYGETKGYNNADGKKMATALAPLAKWMSEKYVFYLYNLKFPFRTGVETNTAFSMSLTLDGVSLSDDTTLKTAVKTNALRLFEKDKKCPTGMEPQNTDLISSCLTEAALMGRVMDQASYVKWLDEFLPPVYSDAFQVYARDVDISHMSTSGPDAQVQMNAASHKVGLCFERAAELMQIAQSLPKDDARVPVFQRLAAMNAQHGYDKFGATGYEGQHWLPYFALLYENAAMGPAPAGPEKAKEQGVGSRE
jgi:hypothetical protein